MGNVCCGPSDNDDGGERKMKSVKQLSPAELAKLSRYQRFEKKFPWYLMNVKDYMHVLHLTVLAEDPEAADHA